MKKTIRPRRELLLAVLALLLVFLIVCPVVSIFAKAVIYDGRLDLYRTWQTLSQSENAQMIANSLLLGVLVVLLSYDLTGFSQNLPVLIDIVCRLITNGLMTEEECSDFFRRIETESKGDG